MKILQVSNRIPFPLNEGGTIGIYNYTKGFYENGCKVSFVSLNASKHHIDIEQANAELSKYCKLYVLNINTDINIFKAFINLFSGKSYNVQRFYNHKFESMLKDILTRQEFDIIQVEGIYASMYADTIRKYSKSPIILRQHNVEYQIWERMANNERNFLKKYYLKLLARRLKKFELIQLNKYDAIIPVTDDDAKVFESEGCIKPIFVSPAGIDVTLFNKNEKKTENPYHIYHLGSLEWLPNRQAVIWFIENVWDKILEIDKRFKLFIAGKNTPSFFKKYETENLVIAGEVSNAIEFISDKSINIVPLLSGSGIRLKILEAMAAGKLVISTTIGAQGIKYNKDKNILIADSAEEFCNIFINISKEADCYAEIKQNAQELIKNEYSNSAVVSKLIYFYKNTFNI